MNNKGLEESAVQQRIDGQVKSVPPAVGEFAIGERDQLLARVAELEQQLDDAGNWDAKQLRVIHGLHDDIAALKQPSAGVDERAAQVNDWFLSLPKERQSILIEDKWLLADAAFKEGQARAQLSAPAGVPDGYVLAPQEIHLAASDIELINGMCGDGNEESGYGPYQDGTLYIGYAEQDDGSKVYGLHISCDECPEEGVTTLAEFSAAPSRGPAIGLSDSRAGRVYIAGPMTGYENYNFAAFNSEADRLRAQGLHVENPADHGVVDGADWADYLRYDIGRLASCERIHLLPGWSKSKGATLEVHIAQELGMHIWYAEGAEPAPASDVVPVLRLADRYLAQLNKGDAEYRNGIEVVRKLRALLNGGRS